MIPDNQLRLRGLLVEPSIVEDGLGPHWGARRSYI